MARNTYNILIGGEAGQGLVSIGELLTKAFVRVGLSVLVNQGYESRIRGGHNTFEIRVSNSEVLSPTEVVDVLLALNEETIKIHTKELAKDAIVVAPYKELSVGRYSNTAALGVVSGIFKLDKNLVSSLVTETFGGKDEKIRQDNLDAFEKGYAWALEKSAKFIELKPTADKQKNIIMNGSDAIAFGAMTAGVRFYSFYPMTPSTSIGLTLAANADKLGMVVEQAEDEIAAINMAIGASYAGATSMVATSGGGFALMVEGVSLAGMTETPIVIVVGQRPAPATGLPTRTEQADLEFVLHSGHGEFPRAIFSPGDVKECFYLTRKAFELAEKSQGPVFILTDQYLADASTNIPKFDLSELTPVKVGASAGGVKLPYKRFALTENGVSKRLLPGLTENLVVVDSDEHTEDGHLTENLEVRKLMVEKRLKKELILRDAVQAPTYYGDKNSETLFVCWGSSKGSVREVVDIIKAKNKKVAMLHFSQVWPLKIEQFQKYLKDAKNIVCVEGNATGQFAKLLTRESGFKVSRHILRYDGLPITPEYIVRFIVSSRASL